MSATRPAEITRARLWAEIDFFVGAGDEVEAGARLHDALRESGWTAADYILLPTEVSEADATEGKQRHLFEEAREAGEAMVIRPIDGPLSE